MFNSACSYTNEKIKILNYGVIFRPSVEELFHPGDEANEFKALMHKVCYLHL